MSTHRGRALVVHATSTLLISAAVAALASVVSAAVAVEAARGTAESVARAVAGTVAVTLAGTDLSRDDPATRVAVLSELDAIVDAGVVDRVKIWQVQGSETVVRYSDDVRNEGLRRPFDPDLAARLDRGEVVVRDIPDDGAHPWESGRTDLLEAFIGFQDATGAAMRLELYLVSTAPQELRRQLGVLLPLATGGPLVLGAATLPLSLRLARRLQEREVERRELLHTALAASDRERLRLAAMLHDGVIQDLAGVGLVLEGLRCNGSETDPVRSATLVRLGDQLESDLDDLRSMLSSLAPPQFTGSLPEALDDLARELQTPSMRIEVDADPRVQVSPTAAALLYRVARELLRNALEHAAPGLVKISLAPDGSTTVLTVTDDGTGFDDSRPAVPGHLGLPLIRHAVLDHGGVLQLNSCPQGTRAVVRLPS